MDFRRLLLALLAAQGVSYPRNRNLAPETSPLPSAQAATLPLPPVGPPGRITCDGPSQRLCWTAATELQWSHLDGVCQTLPPPTTRALVLPATAWTGLRFDALAAARTATPIPTPAFMFDSRLSVLLDANATCTYRVVGDGTADVERRAARLRNASFGVEGVGLRGASPYWASVSDRVRPSAASRLPAWCTPALLSSLNSSTPYGVHAALACGVGIRWVHLTALAGALRAAIRAQFSAPHANAARHPLRGRRVGHGESTAEG